MEPLDSPKMEDGKGFGALVASDPTTQEKQIQELQTQLAAERDCRKEDRFVGVVVIVLLLDVVFFTVMPTFGGPIALLVLELLILIPIARRMGMQEVAQIISAVIHRVAGKASGGD